MCFCTNSGSWAGAIFMNTFSFIILFIIFLIGSYWEYKNKSPFFIFYAGLFILLIVPAFSNAFFGLDRKYPENVYFEANFFSSLYLSVLIVSRVVFSNIFKNKKIWTNFLLKKNYSYTGLIVLLNVILVFCFLSFIFGLKLFSFSALLSLNWWDLVRSNSALVIFGTYLSYLSCSGVLAASLSKNKKLKLFSYSVIFLFIIFSLFILKTRSYVLMFLVPVFLHMIYTKNGLRLLKPVLFLIVMVALFVLARAVRYSNDLNEFLESDIQEGFLAASEGTESVFIDAFYHFIYFNNDFLGFEQNFTLKRIVFFWFKDVKPVEFSYLMHSAYYGSSPSENLSMHPTVFGDAYANAWWFGAFIYAIFLALYISLLELSSKIFSESRNSFKIIIFSLIAITSLMFARGAVYNAFMYSLLPTIFFILVFLIDGRFFNSRFFKVRE